MTFKQSPFHLISGTKGHSSALKQKQEDFVPAHEGADYSKEQISKMTEKEKQGIDGNESNRNYNPKDSEGRSQNVNAKDYIIQDVSEIQENEKGLFITGLDDGSFSNNSTSDTTYIPRGAQHWDGHTYKKGDRLDETDFEEGVGTGFDFDKKEIIKKK